MFIDLFYFMPWHILVLYNLSYTCNSLRSSILFLRPRKAHAVVVAPIIARHRRAAAAVAAAGSNTHEALN